MQIEEDLFEIDEDLFAGDEDLFADDEDLIEGDDPLFEIEDPLFVALGFIQSCRADSLAVALLWARPAPSPPFLDVHSPDF